MCGSKGKCGSEVFKLLKKKKYKVVAEVNKGETTLEEALIQYNQVDYIIDFTNKETALKHIQLCLNKRIPFISGTTGFTKEELEYIRYMCHKNKVKGIICSNFSLPMSCLIKNFDLLSSSFEKVTIKEGHHYTKKDKPSGTGKILVEKAKCKCEIESVDRTDYIIQYVIQFESKYDKMEITYEVYNKTVYAMGVLHYLEHPDDQVFVNLIQ